MRTIFKYPLEVTERQTIMVPTNVATPNEQLALPEFLTVAMQNGQPCIWALVDSDLPPKPYAITLCGTGGACDSPIADYLGTVQMASGRLVLHVFVRQE